MTVDFKYSDLKNSDASISTLKLIESFEEELGQKNLEYLEIQLVNGRGLQCIFRNATSPHAQLYVLQLSCCLDIQETLSAPRFRMQVIPSFFLQQKVNRKLGGSSNIGRSILELLG